MQSIRWALAVGLAAAACKQGAESAKEADSTGLAAGIAAESAGNAPKLSAPRGKAAPPVREQIVTVREEVPGLLAEAKVLPIDAQHLAQTKFPTGDVRAARISRRGKDLAYSYYIQQSGVGGVEEVIVNAMDGQLITSIHRDEAELARVLAARPPD